MKMGMETEKNSIGEKKTKKRLRVLILRCLGR